jgi:hypothetical protein
MLRGLPEHRGIKSQMEGMAWIFPLLDRPDDQRSIQRFHVNAAISFRLIVPVID